jgi:hypothetical protein
MRPGYREQEKDRAVALQQNPFSLASKTGYRVYSSSTDISAVRSTSVSIRTRERVCRATAVISLTACEPAPPRAWPRCLCSRAAAARAGRPFARSLCCLAGFGYRGRRSIDGGRCYRRKYRAPPHAGLAEARHSSRGAASSSAVAPLVSQRRGPGPSRDRHREHCSRGASARRRISRRSHRALRATGWSAGCWLTRVAAATAAEVL